MADFDARAVVVYSSPAGTTRHVAQVISRKVASMHAEVRELDLHGSRGALCGMSPVQAGVNNICFFVGSPVYASHAVPPVMEFIRRLPDGPGAYAVPFVTWGAVTSGIALYEMARALRDKGYRILGAAKVLAVHSIMWRWEKPFGQGHPDPEDDRMVEGLVQGVAEKLADRSPREIQLSDLAYHRREIHAAMEKRTFEKAKADFPQRLIKEDLCTKCGVCENVCPANAITLLPRVNIGAACFYCFNCTRHCPEGAIEADLSWVEQRVQSRVRRIAEEPVTRIFL